MIIGIVALSVMSFSVASPSTANAFTQVPFDTWTYGPGGAWLPTQTAYIPYARFAPELSGGPRLDSPGDFFIDEDAGFIYITNTGVLGTANGTIVILDMDGDFVTVFGAGILGSPMGITIRDGLIYVADRLNQHIYIFDQTTLNLTGQIGRPDSPLLGDTEFRPIKIEVDSGGNIYVLSEGSVSGVMQLTADGEFVGFVGANRTPPNLQNILINLLFSEEQTIFRRSPRSPTNIAMDGRGMLYTVTTGVAGWASVKRLNTGGSVIAEAGGSNIVAVFIDDDQIMYGVHSDGWIVVIDSNFQVVYYFGGGDGSHRLGVLRNPSAITVTRDKRIFVLDGAPSNAITVFDPTEYALLLARAMNYYRDGHYLEGEPVWQEIIDKNPNLILSYRALARANMLRGEHSLALRQFRLAEYRDGYSDAFWQIRNIWLQTHGAGWIISIILLISVIFVTVKLYKKNKLKFLTAPVGYVKKIANYKFLRQLRYAFAFTTKPASSMYEVKARGRASAGSAAVLYVWFIAIQILSVFFTGFLFSATGEVVNGFRLVAITGGVLFSLVLCNYFVSSVTNGEGKFRHCFIAIAYGLAPYLILAPFYFVLTNILTFNEAVFVHIFMGVMMGWTAVTLFRSIMELHDYTAWQTIKNILLTLLTFFLAVLFLLILQMLFAQMFGFGNAVLWEMFNI